MASARQAATQIVTDLQQAGFEAFFAGGCVRDILLERRPKDYDIATSAKPAQVEALFRSTKAVGKAFGVIQVRRAAHCFEVATFRQDHNYTDGRHPSGVTFSSAREDARRRDFTVNAMFFDPVANCCIDYCGGTEDLYKKTIRAVGNPEKRFKEDHLRMLRAVRFAHSLDFRLEPGTAQAIKRQSSSLSRIAPERLRDELIRILQESASAGKALKDLHSLGLLKAMLPKTAASNSGPQISSICSQLNRLPLRLTETALSLLLHRTGASRGKPVTTSVLTSILSSVTAEASSLRLPRKMTRHIAASLYLYWRIRLSRKRIPRDVLPLLAEPQAETAAALLQAVDPVKAHAVNGLAKTVRARLAAKKISGEDLKRAGMKEGPQMKNALWEARILLAEGLSRSEALRRITRS